MDWFLETFGPAFVTFLVAAVAVVAVGVLLWWRDPGRSEVGYSATASRTRAGILLALAIVAILAFTLFPRHARGSVDLVPLQRTWDLLADRDRAVRLIGGNVLLFVPLGASAVLLLRTLGVRAVVRTSVLLGTAVSGAVETLQWLLVTGRSTEVDDVVWNTVGALLGAALATLYCRLTSRIGTSNSG